MNVLEQMQKEGELENLLQPQTKSLLNFKTSAYTHSNQLNTPDTKVMLKAVVAQKTEDCCGNQVDSLFQHAPSIPV